MSVKKGNLVSEKTNGRIAFISAEYAEVMFRAFRHALNAIGGLKDDLSRIQLDKDSCMEFHALKYRLNKYTIFGSDCTWKNQDSELVHVIDMIDMCYKLLLMKSFYTLGDVVYMHRVLTDMEETITKKMKELEEMYSL